MSLPTVDLLAPVPGPSPVGTDLRYAPVYATLTEARREDDDAPQGDWQRTRKTAEYDVVVKIATDALATKSKDLMIAAWLTEALTRREGFAGLAYGLDLMLALLGRYWADIYPPIDDGDLGLRVRPLNWIGSNLDMSVKRVPLVRGTFDYLTYVVSRALGYEAACDGDSTKLANRQRQIDDGKVSPEDFDKAVDATPKAWYKQLVADLERAMASLAALDADATQRFGDDAPTLNKLRDTLAQIRHTAGQLLAKKLLSDPDPVELAPVDGAPGGAPSSNSPSIGGRGAPPGALAAGALSAEPTSLADATARVVSAARWMRKADPGNPASYLMLRGLRWGELRANGRSPNPKLLDAPNSETRVRLKTLMLDAAWDQLLDAGEQVMGTPAGRGWLDLQRYVLTACAGLGSTYDAPAAAIRGALRALLGDIPDLPSMSLMDDMPSANHETRTWLHELVGDPQAAAPAGATPAPPSVPASYVDDRVRSEVQAGRPAQAIDVLMRELDRETSKRGRFLRQAQLARVMVDAGLDSIAKPILEQILNDIETHKLDDWEAGDLIAQPLVLLYRVLAKLGENGDTKQSLYLRICKLDPRQAIAFAGGGGGS